MGLDPVSLALFTGGVLFLVASAARNRHTGWKRAPRTERDLTDYFLWCDELRARVEADPQPAKPAGAATGPVFVPAHAYSSTASLAALATSLGVPSRSPVVQEARETAKPESGIPAR